MVRASINVRRKSIAWPDKSQPSARTLSNINFRGHGRCFFDLNVCLPSFLPVCWVGVFVLIQLIRRVSTRRVENMEVIAGWVFRAHVRHMFDTGFRVSPVSSRGPFDFPQSNHTIFIIGPIGSAAGRPGVLCEHNGREPATRIKCLLSDFGHRTSRPTGRDPRCLITINRKNTENSES